MTTGLGDASGAGAGLDVPFGLPGACGWQGARAGAVWGIVVVASS